MTSIAHLMSADAGRSLTHINFNKRPAPQPERATRRPAPLQIVVPPG